MTAWICNTYLFFFLFFFLLFVITFLFSLFFFLVTALIAFGLLSLFLHDVSTLLMTKARRNVPR